MREKQTNKKGKGHPFLKWKRKTKPRKKRRKNGPKKTTFQEEFEGEQQNALMKRKKRILKKKTGVKCIEKKKQNVKCNVEVVWEPKEQVIGRIKKE